MAWAYFGGDFFIWGGGGCCHHPRKRVIQYSRGSVVKSRSRGVLDAPLKPVIGLAGGETRWRGMTTYLEAKSRLTRRFRATPLLLPDPHRGFRHASRRRRAEGRTAAPARWQHRTSWSTRIHLMARP